MRYFKALKDAFARYVARARWEAYIDHVRYIRPGSRNAMICVTWYRESAGVPNEIIEAGEYTTRDAKEAARVAVRREFTGCEVEISIMRAY